MESNTTGGRFGLMRPLPLSVALTDINRIRSVLRGGGDGFVLVIVTAVLIASAVILALD